MTYANAYAYVARALSSYSSNDTDRTDSAKDAIAAAIAEWNVRRDWNFLRMDTRNGFSVAACTLASGTLTTSTAHGFAGVNPTQTATGATIGTVTVTTVNSTTSLTVTGGVNNGPESMTFSADIPVVSGTDEYNFPSDIKRAYSVRLIGSYERPLSYRDQRFIDRVYFNQSAQNRVPYFYNTFNDDTYSAGKQYGKLRLFPSPGSDDTCRVKYFKNIATPSADADVLEVPDRMVYGLLTLARYYYLMGYDAETQRLAHLERRAEFLFNRAQRDDRMITQDKDLVAVPYHEWGAYVLPQFDDQATY